LCGVCLECPKSNLNVFSAWDLIVELRKGTIGSIEILNLHGVFDCDSSQTDYGELQEIRCALRSHEDAIQGK